MFQYIFDQSPHDRDLNPPTICKISPVSDVLGSEKGKEPVCRVDLL